MSFRVESLTAEEMRKLAKAWNRPPAALPPGTVVLDKANREHLQSIIAAIGVDRAAELSEASRVTLDRAVVGAPIRKGTAALLGAWLAEVAALVGGQDHAA
jgi:hypothetical protein